ncbi:MAG: T9SS type A sorting domain-containing protein [Bacteroidota bacterium]
MKNLLLIILFFYQLVGFTQTYRISNDIPVSNEQGEALVNAWAGGMINAQFSDTDINLDGQKDLVVFDRQDQSFRVFLNTDNESGDNYLYQPAYNEIFEDCSCEEWALLVDANCDGLEDLFCGKGIGAVDVYLQSVEDEEVSFTPWIIDIETVYINPSRLFTERTDIPAILDLDKDGDLDYLTFQVASNFVDYHRNFAMERLGRCDTLIFERETPCWGHFFESSVDNTATVEDTAFCPLNGFSPVDREGVRHIGSTLLVLDLNGDDLQDMLVGDRAFNEVYALYNAGRTDYAYMDSVEVQFPSGDVPIDTYVFPALFHLDVDDDGLEDLLIAPNSENGDVENSQSVSFYKNVGDEDIPVFQLQEKGFLQNSMVELGESANPAFWDANKDGLPDLIIGNTQKLQNIDGVLTGGGRLQLFLNTGTLEQPSFQLADDDMLSLSQRNLLGLTPTAGDLDGDEDEDLLVGTALGEFIYIKNTSSQVGETAFELVDLAYQGLDADAFSAPLLVDMDRDEDLDLLSGTRRGRFFYYENVGSPSTADFQLRTSQWGFTKVPNPFNDTISNSWSKPVFFDLDKDGEQELITGSLGGEVFVYKSISSALTDTLEFIGELNSFDAGRNAAPAIYPNVQADSFQLLIGNKLGGVHLLSQAFNSVTTSISPGLTEALGVQVFPNPSTGLLNISFEEVLTSEADLSFIDPLGKTIFQTSLSSSATISIDHLPSGFYYLRILAGEKIHTEPFVIHK